MDSSFEEATAPKPPEHRLFLCKGPEASVMVVWDKPGTLKTLNPKPKAPKTLTHVLR